MTVTLGVNGLKILLDGIAKIKLGKIRRNKMKTFKEFILEEKNTKSKYLDEKTEAINALKKQLQKNGWKLDGNGKSNVVGGGSMFVSYWKNAKLNDTAIVEIYDYSYGDFNVSFSAEEPWYDEVTHRDDSFDAKKLLKMFDEYISEIDKK